MEWYWIVLIIWVISVIILITRYYVHGVGTIYEKISDGIMLLFAPFTVLYFVCWEIYDFKIKKQKGEIK